jgi:peptidoglycan/LPS O-acetylase OafA/YrhL
MEKAIMVKEDNMIERKWRNVILTISIILLALGVIAFFLIDAQGEPSGGYVNTFGFILLLIGGIQFVTVLSIFVSRDGRNGKVVSPNSTKVGWIIMGVVGVIFVAAGLSVDVNHMPVHGGPYIYTVGNLGIIIGCIYLAMALGTYLRQKLLTNGVVRNSSTWEKSTK